MKTYSAIYDSGKRLFEKIPASELFNKIPGGCHLVSGNTNKYNAKEKKTEVTVQTRYKHGCEFFTVTEDPS